MLLPLVPTTGYKPSILTLGAENAEIQPWLPKIIDIGVRTQNWRDTSSRRSDRSCIIYAIGIISSIVGMYCSAITISQDANLCKSIRKSVVLEEAKLLDTVGTAQLHDELQGTVMKLVKEQEEVLTQQIGVERDILMKLR